MHRARLLGTLTCLVVFELTVHVNVNRNPQPRKVAEIYNEGSISRDGRLFSYWNWDAFDSDLFVRDLRTGKDRHLTNSKRDAGAVGESSVISPDNKHIAYDWFPNDRGAAELRIIGIDGSGVRVLHRVQGARQIQPYGYGEIIPYDWSADGTRILASVRRTPETTEIVLVSVVDGSARTIKTLHSHREASELKRWMNFSPDGRAVAYDAPQDGSRNHDLFALAVDGRSEVPLVQHPANDRLLGWAPDGRILFASSRAGTWGAWAMPVADGKSAGAPELVKAELGAFQHGLGFTRDGSYYYSVSAWTNDVYLAALDSAARRMTSPKKLVSHVGFGTSAEWSPDGQYLAYVSGTGWLYEPLVVGTLGIDTGRTSRLQLNGIERYGDQVFQHHWSPDGRYFLAGGDVLGLSGFYRIDIRTAEVNLVVSDQVPRWSAWSPDGRTIFTRRIAEARSTVIVTRDPATGHEKELYRVAFPARLSNLAVSADAKRLAFASFDQPRGTAIEFMPISGDEAPGVLASIPARENSALALAWTPHSPDIVYAHGFADPERKPELGLWLISADGGVPRNLGLTMNALPFGVSVHPDGRRIAFTAGTRRRAEVWVLDNLLPNARPAK